jgi:hypothetical protein
VTGPRLTPGGGGASGGIVLGTAHLLVEALIWRIV